MSDSQSEPRDPQLDSKDDAQFTFKPVSEPAPLRAKGVSLDGDDIQDAFFMGGGSWICEHPAMA